MRLKMVTRAWTWYSSVLKRKPFLTQSVTTGTVCAVGDIIAQQVVEGKSTHNWRRTSNMAAIGLCFTGPVLTGWFKVLDKTLGKTVSGRDALKKMAVDQLVFAPVLMFCLLSLFGISRGLRGKELKTRVKEEYTTVLFSCYRVWPAVQMINFYFVPLMFRVNFTNIVSLGWNTYLAVVANRHIEKTNQVIKSYKLN